MIRRLFSLIFKLLLLAVIFVALTAFWVVFDGLIDTGREADVAAVPGHTDGVTGASWPAVKLRLDRAAQLYDDKAFSTIIVSGSISRAALDEPATMQAYLLTKGVPASAIIMDHEANDTHDIARHWIAIMKERDFKSLMIVAHYYQVTRLKTAVKLAGVTNVEQAHVGTWQKSDAPDIAHDLFALYDYTARYYLAPAAEKVKEEAKTGQEKMKEEALKAKAKVDKGLDSLAK